MVARLDIFSTLISATTQVFKKSMILMLNLLRQKFCIPVTLEGGRYDCELRMDQLANWVFGSNALKKGQKGESEF